MNDLKQKPFSLRLNHVIKKEIEKEAKKLNISENALINLAINNYLKSLGA